MKMMEINDSVTRLRVEIESEQPLSMKDLPEVQESEPPVEEEEPEPESEPAPEFRQTDSFAYKITKALVEADRHLHLDELEDAMGGPSKAPENLSGNLYSLVNRGYVDKKKKAHPQRDRKMYSYTVTSKGREAVENTT